MKLVLNKAITIPAGTIFDDLVPSVTKRAPDCHAEYLMPFGRNATGVLTVGHEIGDAEFDEWFSVYNEDSPYPKSEGDALTLSHPA